MNDIEAKQSEITPDTLDVHDMIIPGVGAIALDMIPVAGDDVDPLALIRCGQCGGELQHAPDLDDPASSEIAAIRCTACGFLGAYALITIHRPAQRKTKRVGVRAHVDIEIGTTLGTVVARYLMLFALIPDSEAIS